MVYVVVVNLWLLVVFIRWLVLVVSSRVGIVNWEVLVRYDGLV